MSAERDAGTGTVSPAGAADAGARGGAASAAKPIPQITPDLAAFFAAAGEERLVVQRCRECGLRRFPPREICNACLSTASEWTQVSGRGEIFSFNVMHQIYHPGFAAEVPYAVVVVKLDEGPKITSSVVDCAPAELRIGMPVEVVFERVSSEVALPKFRRATR
jgi:uncharacterized OB-fold protein